MATFFNNPPGYPAPVGEVTDQPLFAMNDSNTGYMDEAQRSGAVLTMGDQPVIVVPMRVAPPMHTQDGFSRAYTDDQSRTIERLSPGLPVFVLSSNPMNGCVHAASIHDVNWMLYNNRTRPGFNNGQLIEREIKYAGILSTKLDPSKGLTHEDSVDAHDAYAQQESIVVNVICGGTTPGVTPLGSNSLDQFEKGNSVIPPSPCSPHLTGARIYLILMPTTVKFMRGDVKHPYPSAKQLEHFVSQRKVIGVTDSLQWSASDVVGERDDIHNTKIPDFKNDDLVDSEGKSGNSQDAWIPPLAESKGVAGDVCYQLVPYLTSHAELPDKNQFRAWAGLDAPHIGITLMAVTSVDNPAEHGATHMEPVPHELIHPVTAPTRTIHSSTIQAAVCM